MAVKKITLKNRNGAVWDELYPKTSPDQILTDSNNRFATDTEKVTWNNKQDAIGFPLLNKAGDVMTGPLTLNADPTLAMHAVTKQYVDAAVQGLKIKSSVKAATTMNITLSGTQTVDGVALAAGDRILVKDQATASQNGIYVVASGTWARAADEDIWSEIVSAFTFVEQGTNNADRGFVCTADQGGTLGTTSITWTQFSGAGSFSVAEGTGIDVVQSGNQFTVSHEDTSTQASSTNTGGTVIQSVGLDGMGHVTSLSEKTLAAGDVGAVPTSEVVTTPTANKILKLDSNLKLPGNITGNADGNAGTATKLATARSITISTDATGSANFDGSANITIALTLAGSGVTAGTYTKLTVDSKGRVTVGAKATPADVGITVSATASPPSSPQDGDFWLEVTG